MGFVYKTEEFNKVLEALESKYRILLSGKLNEASIGRLFAMV